MARKRCWAVLGSGKEHIALCFCGVCSMGMGVMVVRFWYRQSSEGRIMVNLGRAYIEIREGIIMVESVECDVGLDRIIT